MDEKNDAPPPTTRKDDLGTTATTTTTSTTTTVAITVTPISPSLIKECYYHGLLPREDVKYLLKNNGDFLVRVSQAKASDSERQIIVSLMVDREAETNLGLRHVVVRKNMGKYQVEEPHRFDLIQELVDYFVRTKTPIYSIVPTSILVTPVGRQKWELHNSDIELTKRLGSGVYGEVYRGKMKRKNHTIDVAVKSAKTATLTKEGAKEMMREARMMRSYVHPNVVRIYGVALDDDPLMIVMELVRGGSLQDYLKKNAGKISDSEKLNHMVSSAAWGLEYLHSRSCIHRDIAARNCLYDKHKNVKISDFGLSREGEKFKMTTTQRIPIKWIAPECLLNFTFTRLSDVFSFGVLVWEIWTNAAEPFEGKKTAEIKNMILDGARLEFPSSTPPDVKELVTQQLWATRPEDRYSMNDVVQRLEQLTGVKQPARKKDRHHHKSRNEVKEDDQQQQNSGYRDSGAKRKGRKEEETKGQSIGKKKGNSTASKHRSISHSTTSTLNSKMENNSAQQDN